MEDGYISPEQKQAIANYYAAKQKFNFWIVCGLGAMVTILLTAMLFAPR